MNAHHSITHKFVNTLELPGTLPPGLLPPNPPGTWRRVPGPCKGKCSPIPMAPLNSSIGSFQHPPFLPPFLNRDLNPCITQNVINNHRHLDLQLVFALCHKFIPCLSNIGHCDCMVNDLICESHTVVYSAECGLEKVNYTDICQGRTREGPIVRRISI